MTFSHPLSSVWRAHRLGGLLLLLGAILPFAAQAEDEDHGPHILEVRGFKYADFYGAPHQTQKKTMLEGGRAQPLANKQTVVYDAKLQLFRENGDPELVVETPLCTLDSSNHLVHSASPLYAHSADGRFSLQGDGFLCLQTNSSLLVSNRVHSRLQPEALAAPALATNTAAPSKAERAPLFIDSERFSYSTNSSIATYSGHVRVTGTNLVLTAGLLSINIPFKEHQIRTITVQDSVVVDYEGMHATGTQAVYTVATGLIEITGQPAWQIGQNSGWGERILLDRTNHFCQTFGHGHLKLPLHGSGSTAFLPQHSLGSNTGGDRFLQAESDFYELHTNWASFQKAVRVTELSGSETLGSMSCQRLDLTFSGTNELRQATAQGQVLIAQSDRQLGGETAVFTGSNSLMTLTGNPWWRAERREGKGDRILVNMAASEMAVHDNAFMRLPANDLSQAASAAVSTNANASRPLASAAQELYATVQSRDYVLRTNDVLFEGGVVIHHPQMLWSCQSLMVELPQKGEHVKNLQAEGNVNFDLFDKRFPLHGAGDRAVYSWDVTQGRTNDLLRLSGAPATLTTTNDAHIQSENDLIILDLGNHRLMAPGDYKIHGSIPTLDTNRFHLPANSVLK